MSKRVVLAVCVALASIYLLGCKGCKSGSQGEAKVEFVDPVESDSLLIDTTVTSYNDYVFTDPQFGLESNPGVPSVWQSFELFFKSCVKSSTFRDKSLFNKYKLLYLGPYNSRYLGTIYSSDGIQGKTELTKWISAQDLRSIISPGVPVPSCDIEQMREKFLDLSLGSVPFSNSDSTLKIAWQNHDTITNSVGTWTIDALNTSEFMKYLNTSTSPDVKWYKEIAFEKRSIISFQIVKVTGFSADISSTKKLNLGVEATIPLVKTTAANGSDSTTFSFKYKTLNEKTIHIESTGEFYVFALAMKAKKMK